MTRAGTSRQQERDSPPGVRRPPTRRRVGEILLSRGAVSAAQLDRAVQTSRRTGSRIGEVLLQQGVIDEVQLASAIAVQAAAPLFRDGEVEADADSSRLLPADLAQLYGVTPVSVHDGTLVVAAEDCRVEDALDEIRRYTDLPVRPMIAPRGVVRRLRQQVYRDQYLKTATVGLLGQSPEECANRVLTRRQKAVALLLLTAALGGLVADPLRTAIALNICAIAFYACSSAYKFTVTAVGARGRSELPVSAEEVAALDDRDLPTYSILVPLFREAQVLPALVESVHRLDYPRTKLDVMLLLEADDTETIAAVESMRLPPHFRTIVLPDARPKTKPKACNYGLIQAAGRYVVVYDAEDRPDRDQLKKAVVAFSKAGDDVICVQCKLNYFNAEQNLLTRWFTCEYSMWFDLLLPGLAARDVPIPLGGTSNHFVTEALVGLGAWDAFNVTEDADLGIRLHKHRLKTVVVDSTTYEEANSELGNWLRQRSRWMKGYAQTWLVHMRHPVLLRRQLGWRGWFSFQMIVGGTVVGALVNPGYWLLTCLWMATHLAVIRAVFPGMLFFAASAGLYLGNFAFVYMNVVGAYRRGYFRLVKFAVLSPLYWILMSLGAWKGVLQLFYRPFFWEKTKHGLVRGGGRREPACGRDVEADRPENEVAA